MTRMAHIRHFADVTVLGGPSNSQLVMSRCKRFESARRLSRFGVGKRITGAEPSPLYRLHLTLVRH
jgi:hypothetical protein